VIELGGGVINTGYLMKANYTYITILKGVTIVSTFQWGGN